MEDHEEALQAEAESGALSGDTLQVALASIPLAVADVLEQISAEEDWREFGPSPYDLKLLKALRQQAARLFPTAARAKSRKRRKKRRAPAP